MRADLSAHSHSSGEPAPSTGQQLPAALRLIFAPALADRIAAAGGDPPDLRRVARLTTRQYRLRQPRHPFKHGADTRPLAPRVWLGPRAALALAFHLALGLDAATLAGIFDHSLEQIEHDLAQARQAVEPAAPLPHPCGRQPALARYRDSLEPNTHLALYSHLRTCDACRAALEGYERVDARLLRESARWAERAARPAAAAPAWRLDALWLGAITGALLLVAGLLATGLVLAGRLGSSGAQAVPLLAQAASAAPGGRLLEVDANRELVIRQLATGRREPLPSSTALGEVDVPYVSPRADLLAIWTRPTAQGFPTALAAISPGWLKIDDLAGRQRWQQVFDSTDVAWTAAGWLGDDRFLLVAVPRARIGESQEDYRARIADQYRLVAVDIHSGAQQTIFQGGFALAQPSPDGSLIALTTGFDERSAGRSLELRAVEGAGLGPPLIDLEQRLASSVIWAPDSGRLIVNLLAVDEAATPSASADVYVTGNSATPTSLAAIDRAGRLRPLAPFSGDDQATPVMVSLDGGSLLYLSGPAGNGRVPRGLLRVSLDGGSPAKVLDAPVLGVSATTVVSPDRRSLLLAVVRPSYLAQDPLPGFQSDALMTELLRLGPDWRVDLLGSSPGATGAVLAWLPDVASADSPAGTATAPRGQTSTPQMVAELDDQFQLAAADSLDPTGRALLLDEGDRTVLWQRAAGQSQLIPAQLGDISWLPGGEGLIGVLPVAEGGRQTSRVAIYTPSLVATLDQTYATQTFDPAQLGTQSDQRYARPLVAPDGDHVAFFVVNPSRQSLALWLAGWDTPAHLIDQWTQPVNRDSANAIPLEALWLDRSTLLVTRPDDWQSGLPQRATLLRVVLGDGGATSLTPLTEVHSLGGDRGIALLDVTLSPNGANLAYRVRHFSRLGPSSGEVDSLILAPAGNLGRQIELARDAPGEGLAWSPDGSLLAAGLGGRIELFTLTDRDGRLLTPPGAQAADPVWLGDQLWFNMNLNGDVGRRVWRAQVR